MCVPNFFTAYHTHTYRQNKVIEGDYGYINVAGWWCIISLFVFWNVFRSFHVWKLSRKKWRKENLGWEMRPEYRMMMMMMIWLSSIIIEWKIDFGVLVLWTHTHNVNTIDNDCWLLLMTIINIFFFFKLIKHDFHCFQCDNVVFIFHFNHRQSSFEFS